MRPPAPPPQLPLLRSYEFGVLSDGKRLPAAVGELPSFTFSSLAQGNNSLYVCAADADGARYCESGVAAVRNPPANFNAAAALDAFNETQAAATGDVAALASVAMAVSNIADFVGSAIAGSNATNSSSTNATAAQAKIDSKAANLITSLAANADVRDPAAMATVVTAVVSLSKASSTMSTSTKANVLAVTSKGACRACAWLACIGRYPALRCAASH